MSTTESYSSDGLPMPLHLGKEQTTSVRLGDWTEFQLDDSGPEVGYIMECLVDEFSQGAPRHWAMFVAKHPRPFEVDDACDWPDFLGRALWPSEAEIEYSGDGVCCYIPTEAIPVDGENIVVFLVHHRDNRQASAAVPGGSLPQLLGV